MQDSIQIEVRNLYGTLQIYPVCGIAKTFADIARLKDPYALHSEAY